MQEHTSQFLLKFLHRYFEISQEKIPNKESRRKIEIISFIGRLIFSTMEDGLLVVLLFLPTAKNPILFSCYLQIF